MRILVYGAGVLGGNLANNLYRSKKEVTILARGRWADEIRENGLRVKKKFRLGMSVCEIPVITELAADDVYDVIFVVMRYTQLDSVIEPLQKNASKNIVFVGNNVRARHYAELLPDKNVMFAFSISAGHRESDRIVALDMKKITIGQLKDAPSNEELISQVFDETGYKVVYEPNMEDYLLCHAAFVIPAAFACYRTDGNLKKVKKDDAYLNKLIDANIEGYSAIERAGHDILPKADREYTSDEYRKLCFKFFKLMCYTSLGKLAAADHAMNAVDEMSALNRDLKQFFDENGAKYDTWRELEKDADGYFPKEI